jgi:hypothetical protein
MGNKVFLDTTPVTVDEEDFNRWVGTCLDIAFGPHPSTSAAPVAGRTGNQPAMDFLALLKMLLTTIGTNMMQFSQAVTPTGGAAGATGGDTALATGKGFDQDQIAKIKDACGVRNAQQIPAIWSVIQSTKGKSFDTYRAHIAKSLKLWCRSHHIDRNKSIFLEAKFFEDLVALRFNPGGPVAQFHSVAQGMLMLACRLLTAMAAARLPIPAGILRIPVFSAPVALFPQESRFLFCRNFFFTTSEILSVWGLCRKLRRT